MDLIRKVIRADGREEPLDGPVSMTDIHLLIGADGCDTVSLVDCIHVMVIDDLGAYSHLPLNDKATALYHAVCRSGTCWPIFGDVVIVPDSDYGGDTDQ